MSRSQAKRLIARFDRFRTVILDFSEVQEIGQAFADELFRVYAGSHREVELLPKNMTEQVERMWLRAVSPRATWHPNRVKQATRAAPGRIHATAPDLLPAASWIEEVKVAVYSTPSHSSAASCQSRKTSVSFPWVAREIAKIYLYFPVSRNKKTQETQGVPGFFMLWADRAMGWSTR